MNGHQSKGTTAAHGGGNAVYALGLIGAAIWFWNEASGFGEHVVGLLKALVWPAFLVYDAFQALHG